VDRQIVYPGGIPLDTDILNIERNVMVALGYLAQAVLGTGTVVDGLACAPTLPASMNVTVGPGSITQYGAVDTLPFGSLPAEPTEPLLRIGVNLLAAQFTLAAPTVSGDAINYLIEATLLEVDATPVVLPYYNSSNPSQPYSGPNGTGTPQNTQRLQQVQLQVKAGAPGGAGTQQTPAVDAGWVGLYVITVPAGASSVVAANIATVPEAPFITTKLPQQTPGTHNLAVFTPVSQGNWTVPAGISSVKLRIWGGGGAGGAGVSGGAAGGGGGGGGYSEGFYPVTPGQSYLVTVGNGGIGSGAAGGTSQFAGLASARGGNAGTDGATGSGGVGGVGGSGGQAAGTGLLISGQPGGSAFEAGTVWVSGAGGGAFGAAGSAAVVAASSNTVNSPASSLPGAGGVGGVGSGFGGQGGPGLVLVDW
jgi:hypothetical protein